MPLFGNIPILLWLALSISHPQPTRNGDPAVRRLTQSVEAYTAGRFADCVKLVAGLDRSTLMNPDAALFIEAQCRFYAGQIKQARSCFTRLITRYPESPHSILAAYRMADCTWRLGAKKKANLQYQKAANLPVDPRVDRVVALFNRSLFLLEEKRVQAGWKLWIQLRNHYPDHPLAESFPAGQPEPQPTFEDVLSFASGLHSVLKWDRALAILDEAPDPSNQLQRYQLASLAGRILFDMRNHYQDAARMLISARDHAPDPVLAEEAWFWGSRALGRAGDDGQAVTSHLAMAKQYPQGRYASRALFYAGWLEQNQGQCERALGLLPEVWERYPKSKWAGNARWFSAWCRIRRKEWNEALVTLKPQCQSAMPGIAGRAWYWSGIAYRALGKLDLAQALWETVIRRFPLSWYAQLARLQLENHALPPPAAPISKTQAAVTDRLLARAEELTEAGLGELAVMLLRHNEKSFLAGHAGLQGQGLIALMDAYRRAGNAQRPWLLSMRHKRIALHQLPTALTRPIWDHAYPAFARDLLESHAGKDKELALFLQAIMRTESGFDPLAQSPANARGLMQMIPPTALRVARELGIDYSDEQLFDPEFNIRTAAWYIGRLTEKFRRQWPLAASAYNAGAPAMMDWCRKNGDLSLDAFVEAIPWEESRRYAKKVVSVFARYAYLEGLPLPKLSLKVDCNFLDDGIDF